MVHVRIQGKGVLSSLDQGTQSQDSWVLFAAPSLTYKFCVYLNEAAVSHLYNANILDIQGKFSLGISGSEVSLVSLLHILGLNFLLGEEALPKRWS